MPTDVDNRARALALFGGSEYPAATDGTVEGVGHAVLYVGDEVRVLGEVLAGASLHAHDAARGLLRTVTAAGLSLIGLALVVGMIVSDGGFPFLVGVAVDVLVLGALAEGGRR